MYKKLNYSCFTLIYISQDYFWTLSMYFYKNNKIMKSKFLYTLTILCLGIFMSCAQSSKTVETSEVEIPEEKVSIIKQQPHKYGGWYCPDNLNGFPAVDIDQWESVPVVNGRLATKEETQNGTSLIFVDQEEYPDAKPMDMIMPKLARYYNEHSGKQEIVIVIQALNISNDAIVGFRYLNGGNGSAWLNEVEFLTDKEIENISSSRFVTLNIDIDATKAKVWDVLTKPEYSKTLQAIFDKENALNADWNTSSKVNFKYPKAGKITSAFGGDVWGNQYIQIDCEEGDYQYVEKFLVSEDDQTNKSHLHIVCGPYGKDFKDQEAILNDWAQEVKSLSEKGK